jgi:hypothetical protein
MSKQPSENSETFLRKLVKEWLSAGLACAIADTIFNPLEVIKIRKQLFGDPTQTLFGI